MYHRAIALKTPIKILLEGEYHQSSEQYEPNYIDVNGQQISRVNVIAKATNKEDELVLDDGTGTIKAMFYETQPKVKDNQTVRVIGKIREMGEERFLAVEAISEIDEKELELRALELKKRSGPEKKPSKPLKKEEVKKVTQKEPEKDIELEIEELEI